MSAVVVAVVDGGGRNMDDDRDSVAIDNVHNDHVDYGTQMMVLEAMPEETVECQM